MFPENNRETIVIFGGGPVGLSCALALANFDFNVFLVIQSEHTNSIPRIDYRTSALFSGSIEFLKNLKIWRACEPESQPIKSIRLIDDTQNLMRSPEIQFHANELGLEFFGFNIPNFILNDALKIEIKKKSNIILEYVDKYPQIEIIDEYTKVTINPERHFCSKILIAADGKDSPLRSIANIPVRRWVYSQSAIVTCFNHRKEHQGISTEFQRLSGPFTIVPLQGRTSSLVWVEETENAKSLYSLSDFELSKKIEDQLCGLLGPISNIGPRAIFPLTCLKPKTFAQNRVALVGEAAHVIPPIGAQGLNLGFRDVAYLVECLTEARNTQNDIGSRKVLSVYNKSRSYDVLSRIYGIDILNSSFLSSHIIPHTLRSLALNGVKMLTPLRKKLMDIGVNPPGRVPNLMQEHLDPSIPSLSKI
ncbi:MAG: FAD-dependent monooxygenase [Hyphomicrobium sp.]